MLTEKKVSMRFNVIASAILRGSWLLDPGTARSYLPLVSNFLKGNTDFEPVGEDERKAYEPKLMGLVIENENNSGKPLIVALNQEGGSNTGQPRKTVAVVPVRGVLMKYDQECGPVGTATIAKSIRRLNTSANVDAIVLDIDSPGGMVGGTQTLVDAVKECTKPVIAFVNDGMAASGAYWIASSCREVYTSHKTNMAGSIGVLVTIMDYKSWYEKEGLPVHEIYSDRSGEKNLSYRKAVKGDYRPIKNETLNPIADEFIAAVKQNRKGKLNIENGDPFKGAVYMAEQAINIGLVDGIKSFDEVIMHAADLSGSVQAETPSTPISTDYPMKITVKQGSQAAAFLNITFLEGETAKEVEITQEQHDGLLAHLENTVSTANTAKTAAEKALSDEKTAHEQTKTELAALKEEPADSQQKPNADEDPEAKEDGIYSEADAKLAALKAQMGVN